MERKLKIAGAFKQYEVAEYVGVTSATFIKFCKAGYIKPAVYPNGMKVYAKKELDRFIDECQL